MRYAQTCFCVCKQAADARAGTALIQLLKSLQPSWTSKEYEVFRINRLQNYEAFG
jgi:hypothetical protein